MGDYIPVFKPGDDITMTAGAAITSGELVYVSAANAVQKTAGANAAWLGVATTDAASGAKVGITSGGVQELVVAAAVVAGDVLISAANGRVTPLASETNYARVVGIALTAQPTTGQKCRVKMAR
jgi:predicted RecA/RadA family phage recombinase